jgi:hypothetical protein
MVLLGLGLILFGIPAISEANHAVPAGIPNPIKVDLACENCHLLALETPDLSPDPFATQPDPCDICHTSAVTTDNPLVAKSNQVEQNLREASERVFRVRESSKYLATDERLDHVIKLLAQAKSALQAGELDTAQDLVSRALGLLAQAENEVHFNLLSQLTQQAVSLVGVSRSSQKYRSQPALDRRTLKLIPSAQDTSSNIFIFDISPRIHRNAEATHRRAPPVEEDVVQAYQQFTHFARLLPLTGEQSFLFSISISEIHGCQPYIRLYFRL